MEIGSYHRSLFLSDLHLGSGTSKALEFCQLLRHVRADTIYLLGDILDGWQLSRRGRSLGISWSGGCQAVMNALLQARRSGTRLVYLHGNHDRHHPNNPLHELAHEVGDAIRHTTADGRELLLVHGDQFDTTQRDYQSAARWVANVHEGVLAGSHMMTQVFSAAGLPPWRISSLMTAPAKRLMKHIAKFDERVRVAVSEANTDGIVIGHTHSPGLVEREQKLFANCGDWLEHCSVLLETHTGQMELWRVANRRSPWAYSREAIVPARP